MENKLNGMWVYQTVIYTEKDGQTYSGIASHVAWGNETFVRERACETLDQEMDWTLRKSRAKGGKIVYAAYVLTGFFSNEQWTAARTAALGQQAVVKIQDGAAAAALLVEFDGKHAEMEELTMKIADAADVDQDVISMKLSEFRDWLYRVFQERFGDGEEQ